MGDHGGAGLLGHVCVSWAEILGALVSILMLWVITGVLVYSAVLRIQSGDYEIDATIMLITAATGVVFNVV